MPWSSREPKERRPRSVLVADCSTSECEPASLCEVAGATGTEEDGRYTLRSAAQDGESFEYLDHTADVQLHGWGSNIQEAFVSTGLAMLNYMTPLKDVPTSSDVHRAFEAEGHDMHSLLFSFLDELLFMFLSELIVLKDLQIISFDRAAWRIHASGTGFVFDREKHQCGTEVKAITYSAMQINEQTAQGDTEVFVVVDI